MTGPSSSDLQQEVRRQREALERIAAICEAVNFPPDLVVDINDLACRGLGRIQGADEVRAFRSPEASARPPHHA